MAGSFKECQGAVKTFRAMVFGVGLGLENVERQSRLNDGVGHQNEQGAVPPSRESANVPYPQRSDPDG